MSGPLPELLALQHGILPGGRDEHFIQAHLGAVGEFRIQGQPKTHPPPAVRNNGHTPLQNPFQDERTQKIALVFGRTQGKLQRILLYIPVRKHIAPQGNIGRFSVNPGLAEEALPVLLPR